MGGFFGVVAGVDAVSDVFFGTDYHSHLGTHRAGIAAFDKEIGLQRVIHNIENSPFRTKFEHISSEMRGNSALGCISDFEPQPLLIRSNIGAYAICFTGVINNSDELIQSVLSHGCKNAYFDAMTGGGVNSTELIASLINQKDNFKDGIQYAQSKIDGTVSILILTDKGTLIAARDRLGRLPIVIGRSENGDYAVSFEAFAFEKLDYVKVKELGPGEIVEVSLDGIEQLAKPGDKMRICSFLWSYYGFPTSCYEDITVEMMRYRNGQILAENEKCDLSDIDYIGGVPDSGTAHAIGYANQSARPFARAFIKYTPTWARSFTSAKQNIRKKIAHMKLIPVVDLIKDKSLLFIDDSVVRGTQFKETVDFLYSNGARAVHMRSACPPIMYGCKYLNFSRATSDMELITRRVIMSLEGEEGFNHIDEYSDASTERGQKMREEICKELHVASIEFQSLEGIIKAIGLEKDQLCTYCWNGKE